MSRVTKIIKPTNRVAKSTLENRVQSPTPAQAPLELNTEFLESLLGYNARRAYLTILGVFFDRMAAHGLRPVDFSLLSLVHHNPGITSRRLSEALSIQPPNLVGKVADLETKGLIKRSIQTSDRRALGLTLTEIGKELALRAEATAEELEKEASSQLTAAERESLISLLKKVYLPAD